MFYEAGIRNLVANFPPRDYIFVLGFYKRFWGIGRQGPQEL
jgi:hypothetical protein